MGIDQRRLDPRRRSAARRRRFSSKAGGVLSSALSKVTGNLSLPASTSSGGEWPTVVDTKNLLDPMVQTDVDRRAAVGTDSWPSMVFDGTDVHLWPCSPGQVSTTKFGVYLWYKPATIGGTKALYGVINGVASCTATRLALYQTNDKLIFECYITNATGRSFLTTATSLAVGAWHCIYAQYDSSRGGDGNAVVYVNAVSRALTVTAIGGAGSTDLTVLPVASGSAVVGGFTDSDTPLSGIDSGGEIGPYIRALNDNLSIAEISALMAFDLSAPLLLAQAKSTMVLTPTATSGSLASAVDTLNAAEPGTAGGTAPQGAADANGLPEFAMLNGNFTLNYTAARNGTPRFGVAMWVRPDTVIGASHGLFAQKGESGGSVARMLIMQSTVDLQWYVHWSNFVTRLATVSGVFFTSTRLFLTCEFDGTQGSDATKAVITINCAPMTPAFIDDSGTPGAMPTSLVQPTGTFCVGSYLVGGGSGLIGRMGHVVVAQPGASLSGGGIWTPAERFALMNALRRT